MAKKQKTQTLSSIDEIADLFVEKAGWTKRVFYPVYPLKEDCYCRVVAGIEEPKPKLEKTEKGVRLLEYPKDPLNDYGKKLVLYFTGGKGLQLVSFVKAFLCQSCGVANPEGYTWNDILSALEVYRESKQIPREAVLNYNPVAARFSFSGDAALFDGTPLKISNKAHRDILELLLENFGCLVSFQAIEGRLESKGEDNRRQALTAIRKAIKQLPFEIPPSTKNRGVMIRTKE